MDENLANTYVYKLLRAGEVVYIGITNDLNLAQFLI